MADTNIENLSVGNFKGTAKDYSVDSERLDSPQPTNETWYQNTRWNIQLGYYKNIPELKASIDAKSRWVIGKGFKSNPITETALSELDGWGNDTFNTILENMHRVAQIGGDSFAEIIRDDESQLMNLKPLNPGNVRIVANKKGRIIRYDYLNQKEVEQSFQPEKIFHLCRDRVGDEIHGVSVIDSVEDLILMRNEAMSDFKKLMHRNVYPMKLIHVDTDDTTQIATIKTNIDKGFTQGENVYVPKGNVEVEVVGTPPSSTLNPLNWIQQLNNYFFQATGTPMIVVGGAQEITEASAKISYLAWEQVVEEDQLYLEEQVLLQLNLEIELEFPASLQNELLSDSSKSETMQATTPEDTSITNVGVEENESVK